MSGAWHRKYNFRCYMKWATQSAENQDRKKEEKSNKGSKVSKSKSSKFMTLQYWWQLQLRTVKQAHVRDATIRIIPWHIKFAFRLYWHYKQFGAANYSTTLHQEYHGIHGHVHVPNSLSKAGHMYNLCSQNRNSCNSNIYLPRSDFRLRLTLGLIRC